MTFEQQIKDLAQATARQISGQIEERLLHLATEASQTAAADRVSVVRELRLAAEAEVAKRSQEAVVAAQADHARRLDEAVALARQEGERRLDEALTAARVESSHRHEQAQAALRADLARERDAAVGIIRAELSREHDAALAAARADMGPQIEAALSVARADAARTLADTLARTQAEADARMAQAVEAARREAGASAQRSLVDARATERQQDLAQFERVRDGVKAIDAAKSLTEALDALAESVAREAPRSAIFVVRGSRLTGWRHSGFPAGVDPARMELPADHPGLLSRALRTGQAVATTEGAPHDSAFASPFNDLSDDHAGLAVPVRIGGETVAVVYADDASDVRDVPNAFPEVVEVLACHAARCLEVLTFTRASAQAQAQAAQVKPTRTPAAAASGAPIAPPQPPLNVTVPDLPPTPRYAPQTRSFQPSGDEDEDSARRYARLLVSEIKLYHEAAVSEGRRNRNLLERLRPEIERAQRLYEERVPVQVRLKADFFGQELVRTLAGGDPALLGAR